MAFEYFVYVLLDDGRPFYVGQSRDERRVFAHMYRARHRAGVRPITRTRDATIHRILTEGRKPELRKIATALTYGEARALERKTIAEMGQLRCETGPLMNGENVSLVSTLRWVLKSNNTASAIGKAIAGAVFEHEAEDIARGVLAALKAKNKPAG